MRSERQVHSAARTAIGLVASVALVLTASFASASASTQSQLQAARSKLAALERRITAAHTQEATLQATLASTLREIDATKRRIEEAGAQLTDIEAREALVHDAVDVDQSQLDRRAAQAYEDPLGSIDVVLGATSIQDLESRLEFVGAVAQSDQALIDTLRSDLAQLAGDRAREQALRQSLQASEASLASQASALTRQLSDQRSLEARLDRDIATARALVKNLKDRRAREIAAAKLAAERAREAQARGSSARSGPAGGPPPTTGAIDGLVANVFAPLGATRVAEALCVADNESSDTPNAVNPYGGAAGVFQFLPSVWPPLSSAAGFGGASVFDANANVRTAEWDVANFGWADWQSDAAACGL